MSTTLGLNSSFYSGLMNPQGGAGPLFARVDKVILGPVDAEGNPDQDFITHGKWASVGGIRFTIVYGNQLNPSNSAVIAKPLNPSISYFPIVTEIVELIPGPSSKLNDDGTAQQLYYRTPFSIWNNVHHNAFPNIVTLTSQTPQINPTYTDTTKGVSTTPTTTSKPASIGSRFPEKSNIANLQPFEGDLTIQGRWGNTIRFGSTVKDSATLNPWSSAGNAGDPIIIIKNGQGKSDATIDPWVNIVEDINNDPASIYLCSGQAIIIADIANFVNANLLATFTLDSKLEEAQVQRPITQPTSTDIKSPALQSETELKYAQASTNVVVPSTVPQTKTIVEYSQPTTQSTTTATVITQTVNPNGTTTTTTITTPIDPNQPRDIGQIATAAITTPNKITTAGSDEVGNNVDSQNNDSSTNKTRNQIVVEGDLEIIESEESDLKFTFDIDKTSGDPQQYIQDDIPDTLSPTNSDTALESKDLTYYYDCAIFNQGDPRWGSNYGGGYTLKRAGCCYCSFAMMVTYHKQNKTYTPQWFWNNIKKSTVVYWADMASGVKLKSSGAVRATTVQLVDNYLKKGPVMIEWDNSSKAKNTNYARLYTARKHWMLVVGKKKDGTYVIQDPNGGKVLINQTRTQIEAGLTRISYII